LYLKHDVAAGRPVVAGTLWSFLVYEMSVKISNDYTLTLMS
jgi:hypothetical protein